MVFEKIKEMIEEMSGENTKISPEMRLMADIGFDSLDIVDLIFDLENEFEIEIEDEELEKIRTVADLVNIIEKKI